MTDVTINANRNPETGLLQGSYMPIDSGVKFIGTSGHGKLLTITDSAGRFGTRANVKPLFVNLGDSRNGSSLGRTTTAIINSSTSIDSSFKNGGLASTHKWDIKTSNAGGIHGAFVFMTDRDKPLIQYIERSYDFDFADPQIQNNSYDVRNNGSINTDVYSITIDGRTYSYTNDGTPASVNNKEIVRPALVVLINADALCKCTASEVGDPDGKQLVLTKKNESENFIVTKTSNLNQNFNNKAARVWADKVGALLQNDVYLLTRNAGFGGSVTNVENASGSISSPAYDAKVEISTLMCEELVFKNSSAGGVSDGFYFHFKNGENLNPTASLVTFNAGGQEKPYRATLNQLSNGPYGYWQSELLMHLGYQCWDDEYRGIYFANSATLTAGTTKPVRQPQTWWTEKVVQIWQVYTHVNPSGAHVHLRTGFDTWVYLGQLS